MKCGYFLGAIGCAAGVPQAEGIIRLISSCTALLSSRINTILQRPSFHNSPFTILSWEKKKGNRLIVYNRCCQQAIGTRLSFQEEAQCGLSQIELTLNQVEKLIKPFMAIKKRCSIGAALKVDILLRTISSNTYLTIQRTHAAK